MEQTTTPSPKDVLLKSIGLGAGFALALCAVIGIWVWSVHQPKPEKPWNPNAIKATWTDLTLSTESERCLFHFRYTLENTTYRDYTIPSTAKLMVRRTRDMSCQDVPEMSWQKGWFIPSRQKLNIEVIVPFNYSDFSFSRAEFDDLGKLSKFADRRLSEIDGFALFDPLNRFRIDFPNGWPNAGKKDNQSRPSN